MSNRVKRLEEALNTRKKAPSEEEVKI